MFCVVRDIGLVHLSWQALDYKGKSPSGVSAISGDYLFVARYAVDPQTCLPIAAAAAGGFYGNASAMGTAPMWARIVRPRCRSSPPAKMRVRAI